MGKLTKDMVGRLVQTKWADRKYPVMGIILSQYRGHRQYKYNILLVGNIIATINSAQIIAIWSEDDTEVIKGFE